MTDPKENLLDFSSKKKKKGKPIITASQTVETKKIQQNVGDAQQQSTVGEASTSAEKPQTDDQNGEVDLPDFGQKKKKSTNVTMETATPVGGAQQQSTVGEANTSAENLEKPQTDDQNGEVDLHDFGQKKKKSKKVIIDDVQQQSTAEVNALAENLDDNLVFAQKKKKKPKTFDEDVKISVKSAVEPDEMITVLTSPPNYTYEMLLTRVFNQIKANNPELMSDQKRRLVMVPPYMARVGTKKTQFSNFNQISRSLSRDPAHLSAYMFAELGTTGSLDANGALLIKGRYQSKHIEPVLRNYCRTYVLCSTCQSPETELCKDSRLLFLQCQRCGSRITVKTVTSGFQAVTGKRAAMRAKAQ